MHSLLALLGFYLLAVSSVITLSQVAVGQEIEVWEQDEFVLDDSVTEQNTSSHSWKQDIRTTLVFSQTQFETGIGNQRGSIQLEFERSFYSDWFFRIDSKVIYFTTNDELVTNDQNAQTQTKWLDFWVQRSNEVCSMKLGRQKLLWGNVDNAFAVDQITPFDYTEQLFTDYSNLRVAQDMLVVDCYQNKHQWQWFYIHDPKLDVFTLDQTDEYAPSSEWGGRWLYYANTVEVSLMAARLMANQINYINQADEEIAQYNRYNLVGLSAVVTRGQWKWNVDLGYQDDQYIVGETRKTDILDFAFGLEYITVTNHRMNLGLWRSRASAAQATDLSYIVFGWDKQYWNDDLLLSALGNYVKRPEYKAMTVFAQYILDDYWRFAMGLTIADVSSQAAEIIYLPQDVELTVQVKLQF